MPIQLFGAMFFVLLAIGMPLFLVLGTTGVTMYWLNDTPLISAFQKMLDSLESETLLAVPFFMMAASFMEKGGVAKALIDFVSLGVGRVPGGLAIAAVAGCTLFSAICGSSVATAMAMGAILAPAMQRRGYPADFSLGILAASGTLGILVPPSLSMILFALIADESVPQLFLAGVVPGALQAGIFVVYAMVYARRHNLPREKPKSRAEKWRIVRDALPALSLPAIIGVGIYGGLTTVTEASVLAAMVALVISIFFYKGFRLRDAIWEISDALRAAAAIVIIIATALVLAQWLTASGIPTDIVRAMTDADLKPWQFLLIVNVILFAMGMFLETVSIMLITLPILVPLLAPLGINPVHFAVVMVINMEMALLTPPVGLNLFVLSNVAKAPLSTVSRGVTPLLLMMLVLLMLVTYLPEISLWLPELVYGR
ncbi:C4-dicarboxylate transporter, DctM subunit [Albimonas donghaensis]|uniref:TRAP transporter large permease protein n=1 Tax=Albimonas donghaensis TaxID=356660 RepID=A0A1H3DU38_9RHOB|nr:TRAP transporter large permease subunit [Albimonas donghaensis]SDX69840.1 C4-dicarboxylate transporter, DctM subunit [Albimonas donghaensis]